MARLKKALGADKQHGVGLHVVGGKVDVDRHASLEYQYYRKPGHPCRRIHKNTFVGQPAETCKKIVVAKIAEIGSVALKILLL